MGETFKAPRDDKKNVTGRFAALAPRPQQSMPDYAPKSDRPVRDSHNEERREPVEAPEGPSLSVSAAQNRVQNPAENFAVPASPSPDLNSERPQVGPAVGDSYYGFLLAHQAFLLTQQAAGQGVARQATPDLGLAERQFSSLDPSRIPSFDTSRHTQHPPDTFEAYKPLSKVARATIGATAAGAALITTFSFSSPGVQYGCSRVDWQTGLCMAAAVRGGPIRDSAVNPRNFLESLIAKLKSLGQSETTTKAVNPNGPAQPEIAPEAVKSLEEMFAVEVPLGSLAVALRDGNAKIDYGKQSIKFPMEKTEDMSFVLQPKSPKAKIVELTRAPSGKVTITYNSDSVGIVNVLSKSIYTADGDPKSGITVSGKSPTGSSSLKFLTELPKGAETATSKVAFATPTSSEQAIAIARLYGAKFTSASVDALATNKCTDPTTGEVLQTTAIFNKKTNDWIRDNMTKWAQTNNITNVEVKITKRTFNTEDILNRSAKYAENHGDKDAGKELKAAQHKFAEGISVSGKINCTPDSQLAGK